MSRLLVVVKSHLFPQFVQLNREIGTGRGHWRVWGCQSRVGGYCTPELLGVVAVESIMPPIKYMYMQNFMFVGVSVIEILEFNQKKEEEDGKTVKYHITSITPVLQHFADFFTISISLVFNMFFTFALVEVKLNGI